VKPTEPRNERAGIEYLDHTADAAIRVRGRTVAEAFKRAASGMFSLMVDVESVHPNVAIRIRCGAPTLADLLVAWLARLLAECDVRGVVFCAFEVSIEQANAECTLSATVRGERLDIGRHRPALEVKGISLLGLLVEEHEGEWVAQCVFDV